MSNTVQEKPEESLSRKTYKFIVDDTKLQNVMDILEKNCNVTKLQELPTNSQVLTSCYFDDDKSTSYYSRVSKNAVSDLMRARTYNNNNSKIYLEVKSNNSLTSNSESYKNRILVNPETFTSILQGFGFKSKTETNLIEQINYLTQTRGAQPVVTTEYLRTSYEKNGMRITLDTNIIGKKVSKSDGMNVFIVNRRICLVNVIKVNE